MAQPKGATMKRRPRQVHVKKVCSRCNRKLAYRALTASMVKLDDGYIRDTICADCMTLEEVGAMAWLEATTEAALNSDGRILMRTRQFPD